jgi:hypothetical protein
MNISICRKLFSRKQIFFRLFLIVNSILFVFVPYVHGREFIVKRTLKGYKMVVTLSQNPPILGKNDIKIKIINSLGESVTDASATVNYFMPPMPGMPPMNYKVKATPTGSEYTAIMDLIMEGPWNIAVMVKVAGKRLKMTVLIDVR